ncbi:lamin tail domain-containing protein [Psychroserpens sp. AS72]|uniref:lamin tail domain-containing protein n=1 Tax=Psychroserpens sp. AS72 TaxID=3135775 RepID=UPI00316C9231
MKHFYAFLVLLLIGNLGFGQTLSSGDLAIIGLSVDDEEALIVALENISSGESVFFTDEEWGGTSFNSGEGFYEWVTPTITAGTVFKIDTNGTSVGGTVTQRAGSFALGNSGDGFYLYQTSTNIYNSGTYTVLGFVGEDGGDAGTLTGTGLTLGTNAIYYGGDNGIYTGTRTGQDKNTYLSLIYGSSWSTSGSAQTFDLTNFTFTASGPANPNAFSANASSSTQIDLTYDDNDPGNNATGDSVVIVFNTDNNFDTPTGTPTVGNFFGDDEILVVGLGTDPDPVFNHTGLTENTTYYYRAYTYDGTDYSSGIDADATTPLACPSISGLSIDSFTDVEAIVSWTAGGLEGEWEIAVQTAGTGTPDNTPGSGTVTTNNPHTESSLTQNTPYEVYVRANCTSNSNGYSNWVGPITFTTEITPPQGSTCDDPIDLGVLPYIALAETTDGFGDDYSGSPGASGCGSTSSYLDGDDIVYTYTSDEDGTININLTSITDTYTGVFIYDSCADIGNSCQAGDVNSSSTLDLNIPLFPVTNGQTYYIVVSTWATPQTTTYDLSITKGTSNLSNIIESGFDEPNNIDYTLYDDVTSGLDETNAIKIGEFTIQDAGNAPTDTDALTTTLTAISFDIIGAANIAAIALIDDTAPILSTYAETSTVTATTTFTGLSISADDDGSKTFSVYVTFDNGNITDNDQIQLTISAASADPSGSVFAAVDAGGAETTLNGDDNKIEVTATSLIIDTNTSNVDVNAIMSPSPTVTAVDDEINTDLDAVTITLTPSVADIYSISASYAEATVSGTATFDNLSFDTVGTGYTLTASSGSLMTEVSTTFDVTTAGDAGGATDLFISEYLEGSSNNKYIEIYNGTGTDVSLTDYSVELYANGASSPSNTEDFTGFGFPATLADGATIVLENSSANIYEGTAFSSSICNFNGDDTVVLKNNGTIIDIVGNIGCDPGSFWSSASNDTQNNTLVRNASICEGVTLDPSNSPCDFPTLESEWIQFPEDDVSNLGSHTANCSATPTCNTFVGNGLNGFGGVLGNGTLEVCAVSGTTIDFTYTRGTDDFNDYMVIYIDSQSGGITDTANLTDTGDDGRKAISGFDGTNRSTLSFPPGFEPDFAISMNNNFAGLFEIVESGSHTFIQDAVLSPTATNNAATYTFNIDFANINSSPNAESLNVLATYLNPSGAFRSNEAIGRMNTVGNPGANPVGMDTYYQSNSGLQGGKAPSVADGLWSESTSWTNGNSPLNSDEITINNVINQDTNYSASSIEITGSNVLTIDSGSTLAMTGGITGTGNINVDGKLILTEGGFTDITPTYGSGSTLEYRNIIATYNRFNEWSNGTALGVGVPDNVIIENASLDLTNGAQSGFVDFTVGANLTVLTSGSLTIDATESLTLGGDLNISAGNLDLNSVSNDYSSLIVSGTSTGDVIYRRHINTFATNPITGNNDLISAPVTNENQTFAVFRNVNTNIPTGTISGVDSYLFGPLNNDTNVYENYTTANDNDILTSGVGYRTATNTATTTHTFIGDVQTGSVPVAINIGAASEWNLVGNPYPSYISSAEFLNENAALLDEDAVGIYGYDGDAGSGWRILNFNTTSSTDYNMAPGQGFLVAAESTGTVNFTTAMQTIIGDDDFIPLRTENNEHLKLQIERGDSNYETDFYFNDNSTLGLDPGYDAKVFGPSAPSFAIYSHLVEDNTGVDFAIQSLNITDLSSVTIPLGVNANQGEQITFSIVESTLPSTIDVYIEDTVANTTTLLNDTNYVLTPNVDLSGTGRFFLRYTEDALSTLENSFNNLNIYTSKATKEIVIAGQLLENTICNIYDIQGRLVSTTELNHTTLENRIDVSTVNTGIYIVKLQSNNLEKTQKLVVE